MINDNSRAVSRVQSKNLPSITDHLKEHPIWGINKFQFDPKDVEKAEKAMRAGISVKDLLNQFGSQSLLESIEFEGNLLLNEGINELTTLLCGGSATAFSAANAYLAVGDDATAAAATQTALQASTNKLYKAMDGSYPTYGTSQQAVWRSTFGTSEANFAWNEFSVANGSSDAAENLNRKVSSQGTKVSGQSWQLTLTITFS